MKIHYITKPLMAFCVLLTCICINVNAQLTNGDYYIRNVAAKQYMAAANSMGTQLSLKNNGDLMRLKALENGCFSMQDAMLLNGKYGSADSYYVGVVSDSASSNNLFIDHVETPYQFKELTDDDKAYINDQAGKTKLSTDKKYYFIAYVDKDANEHYLQMGEKGATNHATIVANPESREADQVWEVMTREELIADLWKNASEENPMWATSLINDPDFSRFMSNMNSKSFKSWWTIDAENRNIAGDAINYCAESWRSAFDFSQTITDLPNGTYRLKAQASVCDYAQTGTDLPYLYATTYETKTTPFVLSSKPSLMEDGESTMNAMSESFLKDKYWTDVIEFSVYDNTLTLGFKGTSIDTWAIFDNVQLEYLGFDATMLHIILDQARDDANELLKCKMNNDIRTALTAVRDEMPALETEQGYLDLINKLYRTIAKAKSSIAEYENIATKIAEINLKVANLDATGQKYFNAISTVDDEKKDESVFTLDGRKVKSGTSLIPGLYIKNGKKVFLSF